MIARMLLNRLSLTGFKGVLGPLLLLLFSGSLQAVDTTTGEPEGLQPLRVQLKWLHQFQFAGYYAAIEQGYYRDAGLEVTLLEHPLNRSPVDVLLSGEAEYVVMGSEVLVERSEGKPLVALAAVTQHDPLALLVKDDSGIETPEDLRGKRVMLDYGAYGASILAMLKRAGLDEGDYQLQKTSYNPSDLVDNKTDAFNAYITNQRFLLEEQGVPSHYLHPSRYGIDFYSDILTTTEQEIEAHPERLQQFLDATLKGWGYAMANSEEVIDLILKSYNTQNRSRAHLQYEATQMREMVHPLLVELGYMHRDRWLHIHETFQSLGFLEQSVDIDELYYRPQSSEADGWRSFVWPLLLLVAIMGGGILLVATWNRKLMQQVALRSSQAERVTEHLELVLQSMNEGLIVTDVNHNIVRVNRKLEQLAERDSAELLGQNISLLFGDLSEAGLLGGQHTLKRGVEGDQIEVKVSGSPLQYAADGESTQGQGAVLLVHDLSDRMRAEYQEQYAAFQAGVADMAASVLHNIGNVITGMSGNVIKIGHHFKLLKKLSASLTYYSEEQAGESAESTAIEVRFEQQRKIIEGTAATLDKLGRQVEESDLLHKLDGGIRHVGDIIAIQQNASRPVIHATKFTLSRMVKDTLNLIDDRLDKYNTVLTVDIAPSIDKVQLPRNPLMQLLLNLIKNSLEAIMEEMLVNSTLSGAIELTVEQGEREQITIILTDNGCGLDAGQSETIFKSGFTTKQRGSGYGLHSAASFVESLGGKIAAQSPGLHQGVTMRIVLPAVVDEQYMRKE